MIRSALRGLQLLLLMVAAAAAGFLAGRLTAPPPDPEVLIRDALEAIAELAVLESHLPVHVIERLDGRFGGLVVRLDAAGVRRIGYDLTEARVLRVDEPGRAVKIALPAAEVLHTELHPKTTVITAYRTGLWPLSIAPASETRLIRQALRTAHRRLAEPQFTPRLRQALERRLEAATRALRRETGWTVRITRPAPHGPARDTNPSASCEGFVARGTATVAAAPALFLDFVKRERNPHPAPPPRRASGIRARVVGLLSPPNAAAWSMLSPPGSPATSITCTQTHKR